MGGECLFLYDRSQQSQPGQSMLGTSGCSV